MLDDYNESLEDRLQENDFDSNSDSDVPLARIVIGSKCKPTTIRRKVEGYLRAVIPPESTNSNPIRILNSHEVCVIESALGYTEPI